MLGGLFSLRKGGRLTQVGLTSTEDQGNVSIPLDLFVLQELAIISSNGNPHSAYPHLLTLVAAGKLNPRALVRKEVSLDRTLPCFCNTGKTGGTQVQHWPVRNESHGNPPLFLDFRRRTMRVRFVSAPGFAGITCFFDNRL
jgi:hypothetical protein